MKSFIRWLTENAQQQEVPQEPGTIPIPSNHIRLYHYTKLQKNMSEEQAAEVLRKNGIDIKHARGSTYGEPNLVWASAEKPHRNHIYVEFSVPWNDPRWIQGKPDSLENAKRYEASGGNAAFMDSVRPDEIIAIHLPWHHTYRYLIKSNLIPDVLSGKYDYLLKNPDSNEAKAINYIKLHHNPSH